jgi:excisionase family DNA binding protein
MRARAKARRKKKLVTTTVPTGVGALSVKETAVYLRVAPITVHRLIARGLLRPNRALRTLRFPIEELSRFLREGME